MRRHHEGAERRLLLLRVATDVVAGVIVIAVAFVVRDMVFPIVDVSPTMPVRVATRTFPPKTPDESTGLVKLPPAALSAEPAASPSAPAAAPALEEAMVPAAAPREEAGDSAAPAAGAAAAEPAASAAARSHEPPAASAGPGPAPDTSRTATATASVSARPLEPPAPVKSAAPEAEIVPPRAKSVPAVSPPPPPAAAAAAQPVKAEPPLALAHAAIHVPKPRIESVRPSIVDEEQALEAVPRSRIAAVEPQPRPRQPGPWDRIQPGQTVEEVRALLGEPRWTEESLVHRFWMYEDRSILGAGVIVFENGRVFSWRLPAGG